MGPKKHTGELWVYIGTPLPNPPITPVFPEGLGRGVPMYTHSSPKFLGSM